MSCRVFLCVFFFLKFLVYQGRRVYPVFLFLGFMGFVGLYGFEFGLSLVFVWVFIGL